MKAGLLHDLLTRGLDKNGNLRNPETHPEQFKDSALGLIPKEWEVVALYNFSDSSPNGFVNSPFGSNLLAKELKKEGIPVIYVRDIDNGNYRRISTVYVTSVKAQELSFCNVSFGDVVVAKVGDPPCISAPYMLTEPAIVTQDVIRIKPSNHVNSLFLSYLINSQLAKKLIEFITIAGTKKRVSLTEFKKLNLPKPSLDEQNRIVTVVSAHDTRIRSEQTYLEKLKKQKQGLMQDLLTGKVRVNLITD